MAGRLVQEAIGKADILRRAHHVAVVGLGDNPMRPAYGVARGLQHRGFKVLPVHPAGGTVLGEPIHRTLAELPVRPDLIDIFRNPVHLPALVEEIIALPAHLQPFALWFQDGVIHEGAAERAVEAGYQVVMDDCTSRVLAHTAA